jgi:hypothetical protein
LHYGRAKEITMKKPFKKLSLSTESVRTLTSPLAAITGAEIKQSVGCLTKDKYTGCPACPTQPTRIFCD